MSLQVSRSSDHWGKEKEGCGGKLLLEGLYMMQYWLTGENCQTLFPEPGISFSRGRSGDDGIERCSRIDASARLLGLGFPG